MTLSPGARLGPYEIIGAIGAGGMGEVFRARDTKLNRDVAIKVLPAAFADDPERLARFTREAQTLASLNHPNIAAIYGIEEVASSASSAGLVAMAKGAGASRALVMELVEGEDLSAHIARGPIPIAEALPIARQIAEALEAAHEQGIVHRDLKPANIKVRTDGTVKVLDFGLAKAMDHGGGATNSALSQSPTMSRHMTEMGVIIGTAAYMSPEQAKGKTVDRRTDIWAFGVVLYEMLSGRRAFKGDDVSETLASVLKDNLSMDELPADAPARLKRLIERCLDRDLKTRLRDIGEARVKIARIETGGPDGTAPVPDTTAAPIVPIWRRALPWAGLATLLGTALLASLVMWASWRSAAVPAPRKLLVSIGVDASLPFGIDSTALSPDGTTLVFVAQAAGEPRQLFIRKLDQLQAAPLAGTDGASSPFFSPDGQWITFFADAKLKKVSITGGAALTLSGASSRGGAWAEDDTIIFLIAGGGTGGRLLRVSASGGAAVEFARLGEEAATQRYPQALPGGKGVLYTEHSALTAFDAANLVVAPLSGGAPKIVVRGGYYGRYVPSGLTSPKRSERDLGHLIYMQQGTLFAQPFSLDHLEAIGPAVPALDGVDANSSVGFAQVKFASDGTLVYVPGTTSTGMLPLNWMTRDGKTSVLRAAKARWGDPQFSPDGRKLAMAITDGKQSDIWVYEWARDTLTQLTFDPADDRHPVWTPDGKRIAFASDRAKPGVRNIYWMNADGTGKPLRLTDGPNGQSPSSWHPGGRFLAYHESSRGAADRDLMILPLEGDDTRGWKPGTPTTFLATEAFETFPMFSPDGRFVAYGSSETGGVGEIYVRSFPGPGGTWRVSTGGGGSPTWSATSHDLLFSSGDKIMVASYTVAGDVFEPGKPQLWSPVAYNPATAQTGPPYALHPDGKRVAVAAAEETTNVTQDKVVLITNFFEYLRKIAPLKP